MAGLPQVTTPFPGSRCPTSPLIVAGGVIPTRMPDVHVSATSSGAAQATSWGRGRQTEGQPGLDRRRGNQKHPRAKRRTPSLLVTMGPSTVRTLCLHSLDVTTVLTRADDSHTKASQETRVTRPQSSCSQPLCTAHSLLANRPHLKPQPSP